MSDAEHIQRAGYQLGNATEGSSFADDDGKCIHCDHAFGPHVVAALVYGIDVPIELGSGKPWPDDAPLGGWMFCPLADCDCHNTWSVDWQGFEHKQAIIDKIPPWETFKAEFPHPPDVHL